MISVGEIVDGVVISVMPFGAFVDIGNKQSGLVHISEVSDTYVKDINDHLKKGDKVKVKVLTVDDSGKINLSIKKAVDKPQKEKPKLKERTKEKTPIRPDEFNWLDNSDKELSFEDKLLKFKQISDENIKTMRRNAESKRSGGYSRKGNY